jgi:hypothetical protein
MIEQVIREVKVSNAGVYNINCCVIQKIEEKEDGNVRVRFACYSLDDDPDCDRTGMPGADYLGYVCPYVFKSACEELFK